MLNKVKMLAVLCVVAVAAVAVAEVQDFNGKTVDIEYWRGAGSNEAVLVLDFSGDSYAFGYRWNDSETFNRTGSSTFVQNNPTGSTALTEALLLSLDEDGVGGKLDVQYTYNNALGFSVDSLIYAGKTIGDGWITSFPAFYISGNPAYDEEIWEEVPPGSGHWEQTGAVHHDANDGDGETWSMSNWGASSRMLLDGYYDGFSRGNPSTFESTPPVTPVPEPATMTLLGIGAVAMLRRRK